VPQGGANHVAIDILTSRIKMNLKLSWSFRFIRKKYKIYKKAPLWRLFASKKRIFRQN